MDLVWVNFEGAIQNALRERRALTEPPTTSDDWMWLTATVTDHVCASIPKDLYEAFQARLAESPPPTDTGFDITPH